VVQLACEAATGARERFETARVMMLRQAGRQANRHSSYRPNMLRTQKYVARRPNMPLPNELTATAVSAKDGSKT